MKYRAELRVIAIARDAVMFLSLVLPLAHPVDDFQIIRDDEFPIAEPLSENLFSFPPEKLLCGRRPAQYLELMIPLDDRVWSFLNVESVSLMIVEH